MSVPSDLSNPARRVPSQARGEARVAALLDAAAAVIGDVGYEAATLTEVATRAGSSIGAVYQYFPNKEAVAHAIRVVYGNEMAELWTPLVAEAPRLSIPELVERMFDVMVDFIEARPAYLPLLAVPSNYRRDPAARNRLRGHFAELFREKQPALTAKEAFRVANVALQIIKGMTVLFTTESVRERQEILREFKLALTAYLNMRLNVAGGK